MFVVLIQGSHDHGTQNEATVVSEDFFHALPMALNGYSWNNAVCMCDVCCIQHARLHGGTTRDDW